MQRGRRHTPRDATPLLADALAADALGQLHQVEPGVVLVEVFGRRYYMHGNPFDGPALVKGGQWTGAYLYEAGPSWPNGGPVLAAAHGNLYTKNSRNRWDKPVGTVEADVSWVPRTSPPVKARKIRVLDGEVDEPVMALPEIVHPVTAPPRPPYGITWVERLVPIAKGPDPPMANGWAGAGFAVHSQGRDWVLRHESSGRALVSDLPSRDWAQYLASKLHDQVPGLGVCRTDTHLANLPNSVKSTAWVLTQWVRGRAKG